MAQASNPPRYRAAAVRGMLLVGLAGAGLVALLSWREAVAARRMAPAPVEVPVLALERHEGRLYRRGRQTLFTGWMIEFHTAGALKSRTEVSNGVLHGVSEGYFTNGVVQARDHFRAGIQEGPHATWHPNGQPRSEGMFVAGQREGLYRRWYADGRLEIEAAFRAGKPDGLSRAWYPSGFLKAEATMRSGEVLRRHVYADGERQEATLLAGTRSAGTADTP